MSNQYWLAKGSHATPEAGRCAMEWVAYLAGEPHTDQPQCVDPPLSVFAIALNDAWGDEQRQKLRPYLARCIGTAGDGRTEERGWLAVDWLIREFTPAFLSLVPALRSHAEKLAGLPPVMTVAALDGAVVLLSSAHADAVRGAVGGAVGDAVRAAARDAAMDAAWDAARGAALDAAVVAARGAAWVVALDAVRAAAWDAVGDAAWDAVGDAVRNALQPTVERLQASALDLFDRMLPKELIQIPAVADAERVCGVTF